MEEKRTDLAYERYTEKGSPAIRISECAVDGCRLHILESEKETDGIPAGRHLTLFFPNEEGDPFSETALLAEALFSLLSAESNRLIGKKKEGIRVLFIGLGNSAVTVDAFGPSAAAKIRPTAHMRRDAPSLFSLLSAAELAVFSPGVSSTTGIESLALLAGVIGVFRPHFILAADSLVAHTPAHLGRVLQISDAGIRPGSGIRRPRAALDAAFAGCPVLTIGMPTAVAGESLLAERREQEAKKNEEFPCGHFFAPASIDAAIEEGATAVARAVERLFGIPR